MSTRPIHTHSFENGQCTVCGAREVEDAPRPVHGPVTYEQMTELINAIRAMDLTLVWIMGVLIVIAAMVLLNIC